MNIDQPEQALVVCPASLILNWRKELSKWLIYDHNIAVPAFEKGTISSKANVLIVSYQSTIVSKYAENIHNFLKSKKTMLFLDEAHELSNPYSKRTKVIYELLWKKTSKLHFLTGTPIRTNVIDMYPMLKMTCPKTFSMTYAEFGERFSFPVYTPSKVEYKGLRNEDELIKLIKPFITIRKKREVAKDLPDVQISEIPLQVQFSEKERKKHAAEKQRASQIVANGGEDHTAASFAHEIGLKKIELIQEYFHSVLPSFGDRQFILMGKHIDVLSEYKRFFQSLGISTEYLHGGCSPKERSKIITSFQEGESRVLISNIKAGGVGLNLQNAHMLFFVELDWSWTTIKQAIDRIDRIGQTTKPFVTMFYAENTIDDAMRHCMNVRKDIADKVF